MMKRRLRGHITPADGNIFADLGFPPDEAARLLADADAKHLAEVIAGMTRADIQKLIAESEPLAEGLREVLKVAGMQRMAERAQELHERGELRTANPTHRPPPKLLRVHTKKSRPGRGGSE